MKLTTEGLQRFVGGQLEAQNMKEHYLYRGEIAEIEVTEGTSFGDRPADECGDLKIKLAWMAKMAKMGEWKADSNLDYSASLIIYSASEISDGCIFLSGMFTGENVALFPKGGSRLEPEKVKGLRFDDERWVVEVEPVATKPWKLEGYDTFEGSFYPLDGEYASEADARAAALDRLEELEQSQPTSSSGGPSCIQDRVFIVDPDGNRNRVFA